MSRARFRITGQKELANAISKIPYAYQATAEYQVLGSGAKVIAKKAKSLAPTGKGPTAGLLKESIGFNIKGVSKFGGTNTGRTARIGPRAGFSKVVGQYTRGEKKGQNIIKQPNFYSHLVEFGTAHSSAQPFIRPAVDSARGEAYEAMARGYQKALDRISKKIRKGGSRRR